MLELVIENRSSASGSQRSNCSLTRAAPAHTVRRAPTPEAGPSTRARRMPVNHVGQRAWSARTEKTR